MISFYFLGELGGRGEGGRGGGGIFLILRAILESAGLSHLGMRLTKLLEINTQTHHQEK